MTKSLALAAIIALAITVPAAAQQKKPAGGDNTAKCRALTRDRVPNYAQPSGKAEAQRVFRACMSNGGKL